MRIVIHPDRDALAEHGARTVADLLRTDGPVSLGLSGGSTPRPLYERLRWETVPWERVHLWLSDERWVPWDDPDSNGRMASETLASHVPASFHRPRWSEHLTAADAAAFYEADLRSVFPEGNPHVVLLGMGDDGHTASLFPGTDALDAPPGRWYVENHVEKLDTWRLTATAELIRRADTVILLVAGADKSAVAAEAIEGPPGVYPVQLVREARGEVIWMLDEAAAADLSAETPTERGV